MCPRHTAVKSEGRVLLQLSDGPKQPEVVILPRHKKYEAAGKKATTMTKVRCQPQIQCWLSWRPEGLGVALLLQAPFITGLKAQTLTQPAIVACLWSLQWLCLI